MKRIISLVAMLLSVGWSAVAAAQPHAQLWINHDKAQRDTLKLAPEFYD